MSKKKATPDSTIISTSQTRRNIEKLIAKNPNNQVLKNYLKKLEGNSSETKNNQDFDIGH